MVDLAAQVISAIASGAGDSLGAKGVDAVARLVSALRDRFRGQPESRGILEISLETPGDAIARDNLIALLRDHIRDDAGFAEWLANLWDEARPDLRADASRSANIITGTVHGSVVQARDIHGDIHMS